MQAGLIPLFLDNAFGVDVDDNYRIVAFKDVGDFELRSHLLRQSGSTFIDSQDKFLREHFCWCLIVNLLDGDISDDYNYRTVQRILEDYEEEPPEADDDIWKDPLGQEILEMWRRRDLEAPKGEEGKQSEVSEEEDDSEEGDDSEEEDSGGEDGTEENI